MHLMNIFLIRWNVGKALEAARQKLQLSLQIKDDIMTSLPSTYLEVYEIHRIAQVRELVDEKNDLGKRNITFVITFLSANFSLKGEIELTPAHFL